jgi:hypothetical protein
VTGMGRRLAALALVLAVVAAAARPCFCSPRPPGHEGKDAPAHSCCPESGGPTVAAGECCPCTGPRSLTAWAFTVETGEASPSLEARTAAPGSVMRPVPFLPPPAVPPVASPPVPLLRI